MRRLTVSNVARASSKRWNTLWTRCLELLTTNQKLPISPMKLMKNNKSPSVTHWKVILEPSSLIMWAFLKRKQYFRIYFDPWTFAKGQKFYICWVTNFSNLYLFVLSIGYTETKYIKLKTKNQIPNFFFLTFQLFYTLLKKGEKKTFFPF